jgi:hypothetical protein
MTTFLSNRDIYTSVVCGIVPQARDFRKLSGFGWWIMTGMMRIYV